MNVGKYIQRYFYICYLLQFEVLDGFGKDVMFINDIYNEFRENEKRIYDDENLENYYYLDFNFVKGDIDFLLYDYVIEKVDYNEVFILFG